MNIYRRNIKRVFNEDNEPSEETNPQTTARLSEQEKRNNFKTEILDNDLLNYVPEKNPYTGENMWSKYGYDMLLAIKEDSRINYKMLNSLGLTRDIARLDKENDSALHKAIDTVYSMLFNLLHERAERSLNGHDKGIKVNLGVFKKVVPPTWRKVKGYNLFEAVINDWAELINDRTMTEIEKLERADSISDEQIADIMSTLGDPDGRLFRGVPKDIKEILVSRGIGTQTGQGTTSHAAMIAERLFKKEYGEHSIANKILLYGRVFGDDDTAETSSYKYLNDAIEREFGPFPEQCSIAGFFNAYVTKFSKSHDEFLSVTDARNSVADAHNQSFRSNAHNDESLITQIVELPKELRAIANYVEDYSRECADWINEIVNNSVELYFIQLCAKMRRISIRDRSEVEVQNDRIQRERDNAQRENPSHASVAELGNVEFTDVSGHGFFAQMPDNIMDSDWWNEEENVKKLVALYSYPLRPAGSGPRTTYTLTETSKFKILYDTGIALAWMEHPDSDPPMPPKVVEHPYFINTLGYQLARLGTPITKFVQEGAKSGRHTEDIERLIKYVAEKNPKSWQSMMRRPGNRGLKAIAERVA